MILTFERISLMWLQDRVGTTADLIKVYERVESEYQESKASELLARKTQPPNLRMSSSINSSQRSDDKVPAINISSLPPTKSEELIEEAQTDENKKREEELLSELSPFL
jgi:hypothetical protein